ncbi:hypothetical protein HLB30_04310 [Peptostreptococcus russellii]|uniref:Uncharacterized protein n=1 Tax=Peptostreptococcus russellii TaxID=215200 RepID=A0A1H8I7H8_9FIRM|nr:DUF6483 family protein [Peptostreptococcus russellii]MBC2577746.1 hypothetical protein [Peptostreptococcus russellii]SEN64095.1 hypothetical protein SAMN05216454_10757 [Peptostreptococcus russellii]
MGLVDRLRNENREKVYKELLGKKYSDIDDFNIAYSPTEEFLLITIKRLVLEKKINEAEDVLFTSLEKNRNDNMLCIAGEFYTMLMDLSDDELKENNFTRAEIKEGINDVKELFNELR